jgi:hypothetical protein
MSEHVDSSRRVAASLVLLKLATNRRQNRLAWGAREIGRIDLTLFTLEVTGEYAWAAARVTADG